MKLTLIYSYFNDPEMLAKQVDEWKKYNGLDVQIIITDDCSTTPIPTDLLKGLPCRAFRITEKKVWNWMSCRNIGVYNSHTDWVFITDIDHVLTREHLVSVLNKLNDLDKRKIYTFLRFWSDGRPERTHGNSFIINKDVYWEIGGFNESYAGGYFGGVGDFSKRRKNKNVVVETLEISLICHYNEKPCTLPREGNVGDKLELKTMSFPYEEVII